MNRLYAEFLRMQIFFRESFECKQPCIQTATNVLKSNGELDNFFIETFDFYGNI